MTINRVFQPWKTDFSINFHESSWKSLKKKLDRWFDQTRRSGQRTTNVCCSTSSTKTRRLIRRMSRFRLFLLWWGRAGAASAHLPLIFFSFFQKKKVGFREWSQKKKSEKRKTLSRILFYAFFRLARFGQLSSLYRHLSEHASHLFYLHLSAH